jgi:hypothetical protein
MKIAMTRLMAPVLWLVVVVSTLAILGLGVAGMAVMPRRKFA